jgi:hypothetical protein
MNNYMNNNNNVNNNININDIHLINNDENI